MMAEFIKVAKTTDIPDPGKQMFEVDDALVVLFHVAGEFFCLDDVCTHDGGPLGEGELCDDNTTIACPRHGAKFAIRTGAAETMPATEATISGRRTIMAGTNNYLGLTFDSDCIAAGQAALAFGEITLPLSAVARIVRAESKVDQYLNRRSELQRTGAAAEEWMAFAEWALREEVAHGAREAAMAAAKREPHLDGPPFRRGQAGHHARS